FLGRGLLCHLQNSSCTLRKYSSYLNFGCTAITADDFHPRRPPFRERRFHVPIFRLWKNARHTFASAASEGCKFAPLDLIGRGRCFQVYLPPLALHNSFSDLRCRLAFLVLG